MKRSVDPCTAIAMQGAVPVPRATTRSGEAYDVHAEVAPEAFGRLQAPLPAQESELGGAPERARPL